MPKIQDWSQDDREALYELVTGCPCVGEFNIIDLTAVGSVLYDNENWGDIDVILWTDDMRGLRKAWQISSYLTFNDLAVKICVADIADFNVKIEGFDPDTREPREYDLQKYSLIDMQVKGGDADDMEDWKTYWKKRKGLS